MWMVVTGVVFVGTLLVIAAGAWWSVFRDVHTDDPVCPRCRSRMILSPSRVVSGLTFQCRHCDPLWRNKAKAWAKSQLRPPE
jgi:tRNA(Ile2) C34 agmatinyltransferase TiaS